MSNSAADAGDVPPGQIPERDASEPIPADPGYSVEEPVSEPESGGGRSFSPGGGRGDKDKGPNSLRTSAPPNFADLPPPTPQMVADGILLGFDPTTSIATFAARINGERQEVEVWVPRSDPLYNAHYRLLIAALDRNGRVPAMKIRVAMPADPAQLPILLLAAPLVKEGENEFSWAAGGGTKLRWTEELDEAVDIDFDRFADLHAAQYLKAMLQAPDPVAEYANARAIAKAIFCAEAGGLGLTGDTGALFEHYAPNTMAQVIAGVEIVGGKAHPVRYDTRYKFRQQAKQLATNGDEASVASALANYSSQQGVSVDAASRASQFVDIGGGKTGSLAEAHQVELVTRRGILASNPSLAEHKEIFAEYSHEAVRSAVAANLAGMMDAAGIPSARPEIDHIEHDKKNAESKHVLVMNSIPADILKSPDAGVRAGGYLKTSQAMEETFRAVSFESVAGAQAHAGPREIREVPQRPNAVADIIKGGLKALETGLDLMS